MNGQTTAELLHPRPLRLGWDDTAAAAGVQRSLVERRIEEALEIASQDRLVRGARGTSSVRGRVGHAISELGDRIAGPSTATRAT
jgi:hypothetical protein